ncbi:MAG: insulinase family protein [Bacteroidetes bacterium]|nr:insulinase family protein [Bacteroidota bacterium]
MRNFRKIALAFIGFYAFVLSNQAQNVPLPIIEQYTLANGLTVILSEDHAKPEVFGVVVTKAGSKNDPADATGMAHYQEHMLFKGTEELGTINWQLEKPLIDKIFELYDSLGKTKDAKAREAIQTQINEYSMKAGGYAIPNELDKIIKSIGGTKVNANTSADRTIFFNAFPPNQIEKWLDLYAHRFQNPVFRSFQSELEVVYEEKNLYNDNFSTGLIETFNKNFFKKHPYGQQSTIGTVENLKNPSLTKMYNFFKTYYVANNMALVITGDFNIEEIKPIIEKKFGVWRRGDLPKFPTYVEEPFKGREFVSAKLSPIKIGLFGFRTPANGDADEVALKVCNSILSNDNQTGLLDKLTLDSKLMAGVVLTMPYNDYGETFVLAVPKILGQSLDDAEKLVMGEFAKLRNGEFDDWMVDAVKNQLYKEFQLDLENSQDKALLISESFAQNKNINDYLNLYLKQIKSITKADVMNVAKKYYGDNYLAFYSKMGFPKKEKLEKPNYKPLQPKMNQESPYATVFKNINTKAPEPKFINFSQDVKVGQIFEKAVLYYAVNPKNDVFSLKIKYGIGEHKNPKLKQAAELMNLCGTKRLKLVDLKSEFSKIGCSYSVSSDESYIIIELEGIESNMSIAISLIKELISEPVIDKEKLKVILEGEKTNRKMENTEPENIAKALIEFVKYKEESSFLRRLSIKEMEKLDADSLVDIFKSAIKYEYEVHYCGQYDFEKVLPIMKEKLNNPPDFMQSESPVVRNEQIITENTVYLVNNKNALQSKIYLFVNGGVYKTELEPSIEAFNQYFSGDFSGLVLQEIREFRSLAYGAGAKYSIPKLIEKKSSLTGFVGTQADKTLEAIQVFTDLISKMPEKPERIENIKSYLIQSALTNKPGFRDLTETVEAWKLRGFIDDPAKSKIEAYQKITFQDLLNFYKTNIQNKPIAIAIVGDKKRIDLELLKKFGKIIEIKENQIFK